MSETASRLTWHDGRYNSESGVAGGTTLFVIDWHTQRNRPDWQLRSELPGLQAQTWEDDDKDALKAQAEQVLDGWLARVNGQEG